MQRMPRLLLAVRLAIFSSGCRIMGCCCTRETMLELENTGVPMQLSLLSHLSQRFYFSQAEEHREVTPFTIQHMQFSPATCQPDIWQIHFFCPTSDTDISIKKSSDGKTISFYGGNESAQKNESGVRYYFAAIASPVTEWTITTSGNWIVPRTGKYYLELYGGGGVPSNFAARQYSGGSSCQSYDSVSLAAGDSIAVSIGVGGTYASNGSKVTAGTGTTFGSYSVAAGGNSTSSAGGKAAGNKGAVGNRSSSQYSSVATFTSGVLYTSYGLFYGSGTSADTNTVSTSANDGAVYLKYLGS